MPKYLAIYNVHIQPFEEAPETEKRIYDLIASDDAGDAF